MEVVKHFFTDAVSGPNGEDYVDRLNVVSMTLCKAMKDTEHETIIIQTYDPKDRQNRLFTLHRVPGKPSTSPPTTKQDSTLQGIDLNKLLEGITNLIPAPSRPPSPASLMEEGRYPTPASSSSSNLHPPVMFLTSQRSFGDIVTIKAAQSISESKDKSAESLPLDANDKLLGQEFTVNAQFACSQNARVLTPKNLTLFELVILAQTVHEHAPHYTLLGKNCFWYCNMIFDACIELFQPDDFDITAVNGVTKFTPHEKGISGRYRGFKVNETNRAELSLILRKYKDAHTQAFGKVKIFFV